MPDHDFRGPSVEAFLESLGGDGPAPGGGSAAAMAAAMGASLVRMVAILTVGREGYADHERLMQAVAEQAEEERATLTSLAEEDASALDALIAAYALPGQADAEAPLRARAVAEARRTACEVPLKIMERCLEVIGLARNAVTRGFRNAAPDGAAGSELALAALKIAGSLVSANLQSIDDDAYTKAANKRMDEMMYMGVNTANAVEGHLRDLAAQGGATT